MSIRHFRPFRFFSFTTTDPIPITQEQRPVVKKLVAKQSLAEIARLADSDALEIVVSETVHQTQFVSHAKAVLSPSPSRRVR